MISVRSLHNDISTWNVFTEAHPKATYAHDAAYIQSISAAYKLSYYLLGAYYRDRLIAVLPIVISPKRGFRGSQKAISIPYSNYGGILAAPSYESEDCMAAFLKHLEKKAIHFVETRQLGSENTDSPEKTFVLNLPVDEQTLWRSFKDKVRNQIRKGEKLSFVPNWDNENLRVFYELYLDNMAYHGTPVHSFSFFEAIYARLGDRCKVLSLQHEGKSVAAMMVIVFKGTWTIPYAACSNDFKRKNANMVLYWAAMQKAIENKATAFDFGRSHVSSGTCHFKRQWGSNIYSIEQKTFENGNSVLTSTTSLYRSTSAMRVASLWKQLPLSFQRYCGPIIRRHLP